MEEEKGKEKTIILLGLPEDTTEDKVKEYIESYGEVVKCKVKINKRKEAKATVIMKGAVDKFAAHPVHVIGGKEVIWKLRGKEKDIEGAKHSILIQDLPTTIKKDELTTYFGRYGDVKGCKVNKKGKMGSIIFSSQKDYEEVLKIGDHMVNGKSIKCVPGDLRQELQSMHIKESEYKKKEEREKRRKDRDAEREKRKQDRAAQKVKEKSIYPGNAVFPLKENMLLEDVKESHINLHKSQVAKKYRLTVGKIPLSATEDEIKKYFEQFGRIVKTSLHMIGEKFSGRCFVWFDSEGSLEHALKSEHKFQNAVLRCWVGSLRNQKQQDSVPPVVPKVVPEKPAEESKENLIRAKIEILSEQLQEYDDMLDTYICPISYTLMNNPVTAEDGHTYERENVEAWLNKSNTSPVTRAVLATKKLIPNVKAKQSIRELTEKRSKCVEKIAELNKMLNAENE